MGGEEGGEEIESKKDEDEVGNDEGGLLSGTDDSILVSWIVGFLYSSEIDNGDGVCGKHELDLLYGRWQA